MRVLVLGKNGLLGKALVKSFQKEDFFALDRSELDLTNEHDVFEKLMTIQPELVINATGYTNVEKAETEEDEANKINGYAIGVLARACREIGATLVHFSTDYVFEGILKDGYDENARMNPINAYGRSKMLGELLLEEEMELEDPNFRSEAGKYFIIRTSWLFGHGGISFVEKILTRLNEDEPIRVVDDQFGKPTYVNDLVEQVKWLIESNEYPSGIYHITNSEKTNWYQFAKEIVKLANGDILKVGALKTANLKMAAQRPLNSTLLNTKLPELRSWKDALKDYFDTK